MPIYEYQCSACGEIFEAFQKISDSPLSRCKYCNSSKIEKLISQSSFQFKGAGWYLTDYARKSESAKTGESDGKSDVKPQAKADKATDAKGSSAKKD